ncbi:MAG: hypothetical protein AAF561_05325 [Planctomycetota bacterium]
MPTSTSNPPATPPLRYARTSRQVVGGLSSVPGELLHVGNAMTLVVCVGIVAVAHGLALFAINGAVPMAIPVLLCLIALGSHYVNVLDDLGPQALDDLPPVLRNADWPDDVWRPVWRLTWALVLTFGPAIAMWQVDSILAQAGAVLLGSVGLGLLPVVLLTLVEGSSAANLDPRRLLRAVRICGLGYAWTTLAFVAALALHGLAGWLLYVSLEIAVGRSFFNGRMLPLAPVLGITYAVVIAAIYAAHLAAALMARLYRLHHERFPWLLQRHERRTPSPGSTMPDGC